MFRSILAITVHELCRNSLLKRKKNHFVGVYGKGIIESRVQVSRVRFEKPLDAGTRGCGDAVVQGSLGAWALGRMGEGSKRGRGVILVSAWKS